MSVNHLNKSMSRWFVREIFPRYSSHSQDPTRTSHHPFCNIDQRLQVSVCLVELARCELGVMIGIDALVAELLSELVNAVEATNDELL
ncbi:hypothetical protein BC936DRAFT_146182 [Jimgerdemannia flammicorona]|uniref:Uncharacterized protein n=2 Tax=Jimgerdemannia flammicorona TaxID=994334 RepID=A0A433QKJ5_9FUNG|nr:hypothetical protein BC936DRAFT_146182 [Jimgerdemannia flammicorona]RUS30285.1 hypothetical protein BC938DRAFT_479614 [Jimgerdemannia flammicorona]